MSASEPQRQPPAPSADYERLIEQHREAIEQARRNVEHGWGGNGMAISEALVALVEAIGGQTETPAKLLCENCGKTMAEHDAMAHCWPNLTAACADRQARREEGDDYERDDFFEDREVTERRAAELDWGQRG